ncbi:rhomboid family intramembrane serine protease [Cloacibacterium sp.]|uniref:rhomboid family intramembrane serine protease n=1 Tax=Cloacibacterium sp. TaxID=1913682 RepID=UPI0035AE2EEC
MFQQLTPITKNIIILNVIVFVLAYLFPQMLGNFAAFFPTSPYFKSWQIITHMFMHGGFMHIAFNMLTLASFGPVLERFLGDKKFLILYFISGLGAFVLFNLWELFQLYQDAKPMIAEGYAFSDILYGNFGEIPRNLEESAMSVAEILKTPMVGASGAIFGVIAAFSVLYPNAEMFIMFIPFPIKAKVLFPIAIVVSLFLGISGSGGNIAHFAHIGGALVGFLLVKYWGRNRYRIN